MGEAGMHGAEKRGESGIGGNSQRAIAQQRDSIEHNSARAIAQWRDSIEHNSARAITQRRDSIEHNSARAIAQWRDSIGDNNRRAVGDSNRRAIAAGDSIGNRPDRETNTVFIGKKETMGYVLAVVTIFTHGAKEVRIKARGKLISRAVDVAEAVRHNYIQGLKIKGINLSTDELVDRDGAKVKVSAMEIILEK